MVELLPPNNCATKFCAGPEYDVPVPNALVDDDALAAALPLAPLALVIDAALTVKSRMTEVAAGGANTDANNPVPHNTVNATT